MRISPIVAGAATLALVASPALAWTSEDHEIFDLVSALEAAEGKGTTFYTFLNTTKGATDKELSKAYRKRSLELHPDKNPNNKKIADRFARLGVINAVLKDEDKRKRYDFFHDNGVPKWRGTGYYYSRYRPGLGSVVGGLVVFSCFVQYIFLYLTWRVQKMRIGQFRTQALEAAWGPTKKPLNGRKKLKVKLAEQGDPLGLPGINGGKPTGPNSVVEMVVEGDDVFIVENRKENLLNEECAIKPSIRDTWLPKQIIRYVPALAGSASSTASASAASKKSKKTYRKPTATDLTSGDETGGATSDDGGATSGGEGRPRPAGKGIEGMGKVGGRRRKTIPRPASAQK
ncbi:hypothetical protein JCM10207_004546 [Rhodosporidiobolus poonsookiae]